MKLHIQGGRLIDPANNIDAPHDLYVADGKIVAIGQAPDGFSAEQTINASGQIVCPGLVDLAAHFREPGKEHKATIASESRAAVKGGITTVCCPPNTDPIADTPAVAELIHQKAELAGLVNIVSIGALTQGLEGRHITNMASLKTAGCVGVGNALKPVSNPVIMRRAMEYAATQDLTVFIHPEDQDLRDDGCVHEGPVSTRLGLPGIPVAAETVAVARELALIEQTGCRAHFHRISSARAVQMISRAQYDGLPITADVTSHHLHLNEYDLIDFNSNCHVRPPLRSQRDMEGLRSGVAKNIIAAICSDHLPHEPDAKLNPFSQTEHGISALETFLPLCLRLTEDSDINTSDLISRITHQPANILGINKGHLSVNADADICIFDPKTIWVLEEGHLVSHGKNSPFIGWQLQGRVNYTLSKGRIVFDTNA